MAVCKRGHSGAARNSQGDCIECNRARQKAKYDADPTRRENAIKRAALNRNAPYAVRSRRNWRLNNKSKIRGQVAEWRRKNPGRGASYSAKRRALIKVQRCSCCTDAEIQRIYLVAALMPYEVDHGRPLELGGPHCCHNLQILSPEAHRIKTVQDNHAIRAAKRGK